MTTETEVSSEQLRVASVYLREDADFVREVTETDHPGVADGLEAVAWFLERTAKLFERDA